MFETTRNTGPQRSMGGFSMVELLVTALILGIGLLGLLTLQTVIIRHNSSSKSMGRAVRVAESVVERVITEARQDRLFMISQAAVPSASMLSASASATLYYKSDGNVWTASDPASEKFFTVNYSFIPSSENPTFGKIGLVSVSVAFRDTVINGASVERSFRLQRQVTYA